MRTLLVCFSFFNDIHSGVRTQAGMGGWGLTVGLIVDAVVQA